MKQKLHHKKKRGSLYEPLILLYEMNLDVNIYYRLSLSTTLDHLFLNTSQGTSPSPLCLSSYFVSSPILWEMPSAVR